MVSEMLELGEKENENEDEEKKNMCAP